MENTCTGSGAAGIHVTGGRTRIDSNQAVGNERGIDVDGTGNLIIRNVAGLNNTQYDSVSGNRDAQALSPGSGFISTDPWANFIY